MKIVQCWDDGVVDDIRLIEILRKHGAKASFNLNIGMHGPQRQGDWKFQDVKLVQRLALGELTGVYEGFLVANHTVSHPFLTQLPPEKARREIAEGRDRLEQLLGYEVRGFAYPFGDQNAVVEEIVRETGHLYARSTANATPCFPPANPMHFDADAHFLDPAFWSRFEKAQATSDVFYFWGHSYELVTEKDWQAFDNQIARLTREGEWANLPDLFR